MKKITLLFLVLSLPLGAQNRTQNGELTGQKMYPLLNYFELPQPVDTSAWANVKGIRVSWGSADADYAKREVPALKERRSLTLKAWKGERVMAQALLWSAREAEDIRFSLDCPFPAECGFVRYNPGPDVIDTFPESLDLMPMSVQPYWICLSVPADAAPGVYKGVLMVQSGTQTLERLRFSLEVLPRSLPEPSRWKGVPEIVPNPWSVARYYHVEEWKTEYTEPWSEKHFENMRPLMERLAGIGVRNIWVSVSELPWKTTDPYRSMVTRVRFGNGSWKSYNDVQDAWVAFMRSCGFDGRVYPLKEDGPLPMQYCSWPREVLLDGRVAPEHPDDGFLVYPLNRPSVRWMRLLEEIQRQQKFVE